MASLVQSGQSLIRRVVAVLVGALYGGALAIMFWLTNEAFKGGLPIGAWILPVLVVIGAVAGFMAWEEASHGPVLGIAVALALLGPFLLFKFAPRDVLRHAPPEWRDWLRQARYLMDWADGSRRRR